MRHLLMLAAVGAVASLPFAGSANAQLPPATTKIQAVVQATQQYGWPHARTFQETVGIPITLRYDVTRGLRSQGVRSIVKVSCKWVGTRVAPRRCTVTLTHPRTRRVQARQNYRLVIFEDGSYYGIAVT